MENEEEEFLSKKRKKEKCQICKVNEYKYTCPKCFTKTCSVNCVKSHKKRFNCNGERDKFKKVNSKDEYNEKVFYRDISFMNNSINRINTSNKKVFELSENNIERIKAKTFKNFKRICKKFRNITYHKSPLIFQCSKENNSYSDSSSKKVYWTIKLNLEEEKIQHVFKNVFDDEVETLETIGKYLYEHKNLIDEGELLKFIDDKDWVKNWKFCLRNFNNQKLGKYIECDKNTLLKDLLNGTEIFEYPEFFLFKKKDL